MRRSLLPWALASLIGALACSSSHSAGDAGADTGTDTGADAGPCAACPSTCCTHDPISGATVAPFCLSPGMECAGPPITCPGTCGPVPPGCVSTNAPPVCDCSYSCPDGGVPSDCNLRSEADCASDPACAAVYDDECCPSCGAGGFCADCTDPFFIDCMDRATACSPAVDLCGQVPSCAGPIDCSSAVANVSLGSCSLPGCVPVIDASCTGGCAARCVPASTESCEALCDIPSPACGLMGWTAEIRDGCYTGACVPTSVCRMPAASL